MIERQNWLDVKKFIAYQDETGQKDPETLRNYWVALRHLLQWADKIPFPMAGKISPPFPVYLLKARNDGDYQPEDRSSKPLSFAMQSKILSTSRMFFTWARQQHIARYRPLTLSWVNTLQPSRRAARENAKIRKIEAWTLEDVLKVAALTDHDLRIARLDGLELDGLAKDEKYGRLDLSLLRAQAAIVFLYLSGMRAAAFLSLPVSCVNIAERTIEQDPARGVLTKFRKAAVTSLLPIPELMPVVERWDALVKAENPGGRWFASMNHWGTAFNTNGLLKSEKMRAKRTGLISGMERVCALAGVPYKSPHKLRHGHAVYGVKHARTIAELKAVSQNLMHESIQITDGIYGNLTNEDARRVLAGLANPEQQPGQAQITPEAMAELQKAFLAFLASQQKKSDE